MQQLICIDGAPCAMKAARTVRCGGKFALTTISGDMAKAVDYLSQFRLGQGEGGPYRGEDHLHR